MNTSGSTFLYDDKTGSRLTGFTIARVEDVNDNAPRFWRDQYESFLPENSNAFESPLVIQAEDRDENGR